MLFATACGVPGDLPAIQNARLGSASASATLGAASSFAVLGGPALTCTTSEVTGDAGTGLPGAPVTQTSCPVTGTVHAGDAAAAAAYNDFLLAYLELGSTACSTDPTHTLTGTLADVTLQPGVYCFDAAAALTGVLTLDANGAADATWLIKVGSGPTGGALTGTNFSVVMAGGGLPCNVSWWVADAATMTTSSFQGSLFVGADITFTGPGSFVGQALAKGAVTLTDVTPFGGCTAAGPGPGPGPGSCSGSGDRVTGGGFIGKGSWHMERNTFAVGGGIKSGGLRGHLQYRAHGLNGIKVKGTGVTQYLVVDAVSRHIEGTANVNGVSGFTYQVDVSDNGEPGRKDTFAIGILDAAGASVYSASGKLGGGNIQLHKARRCNDDGDDNDDDGDDDDGDDDHDDDDDDDDGDDHDGGERHSE